MQTAKQPGNLLGVSNCIYIASDLVYMLIIKGLEWHTPHVPHGTTEGTTTAQTTEGTNTAQTIEGTNTAHQVHVFNCTS